MHMIIKKENKLKDFLPGMKKGAFNTGTNLLMELFSSIPRIFPYAPVYSAVGSHKLNSPVSFT